MTHSEKPASEEFLLVAQTRTNNKAQAVCTLQKQRDLIQIPWRIKFTTFPSCIEILDYK